MIRLLITSFVLLLLPSLRSQDVFEYTVALQPVQISGLPGLHSFAFAQHDGKWLVIGGRKDGIHARQPFNAFPASDNNTDIYVIDIEAKEIWASTLNLLPDGLREQLQSTNMNFFQDQDTLYIIGGYAYSEKEGDHITFPFLTSVQVSGLMEDIIHGKDIGSRFRQISDTAFAVTGGHLGKIDDTYYLVGGQRFDGRYNPMGHPTFIQAYTNQIRKFNLDNSGDQLHFSNYTTLTDPVHLRRRDYNLLPQIYPDGQRGYMISSGVFQLLADVPFLYPVEITETGYRPVTQFNQYLSHYHSAFACLYDSVSNQMHNLFFGGMSQYYYKNGTLIEDQQVPFVNTISRVTRYADGALQEFQLPVQMPGLQGAGAEFIPNHSLPHDDSEIFKLDHFNADTLLIGYILGGLASPVLNPFSNNESSLTYASNTIYAVRLVRNIPSGINRIDGQNPFDFTIFPNPTDKEIEVQFDLPKKANVFFMVSNSSGQLLAQGTMEGIHKGENHFSITLDQAMSAQMHYLTLVFDDIFFVSKGLLRQ